MTEKYQIKFNSQKIWVLSLISNKREGVLYWQKEVKYCSLKDEPYVFILKENNEKQD